ncbi:MAG: hypothetical protein QM758_09105 [Armatimonas sp.]
MSRLKRFAIATVVTLALPGGATTLWYQSHYVAPLAPQILPSPNGYDTLEEAINLCCLPSDEPSQVIEEIYLTAKHWSLARRQKLLAANKPSLEKTREALRQEYVVPRVTPIDIAPYRFHRHQDLLLFAAQTCADSGDLTEAMHYALDAVELGVLVPRGRGFQDRQEGYGYEIRGRQMVWQLAARVNAKTAREAGVRLAQAETRRWPLSENWRKETTQHDTENQMISTFGAGPFYAWKQMGQEATYPNNIYELWGRARAVYGGPKALADWEDDSFKHLQERLDRPWELERAWGELWLQLRYAPYGTIPVELAEYLNRAQGTLLKTYLALRTYRLEHGSYPDSLENLVAADYLEAIPIDPFSPTRAPLRYKPNGVLWSVGPDAVDNGGQAFALENAQKSEGGVLACLIYGGYDLILPSIALGMDSSAL